MAIGSVTDPETSLSGSSGTADARAGGEAGSSPVDPATGGSRSPAVSGGMRDSGGDAMGDAHLLAGLDWVLGL
jgi:hypothetical protein